MLSKDEIRLLDNILFSCDLKKDEEVKLYRRSDVEARKNAKATDKAAVVDELSQAICNGLGGKKNISDVDCCATRLRCTVYEAELVSDEILKATGASGVVHKGNGVQIIYGPRVTVIKSNLEDYLLRKWEKQEVQLLSTKEQMEEFMFLGLRMTQGVSKEEFKTCFGVDIDSVFCEAIRKNIDAGLLLEQGNRLSLTKKGLDVSNYVMAQFLIEEL